MLAVILTASAGCVGNADDTMLLQSALSADVFVTRAGPELRVGSAPFYYAGTNNYYLWYQPFDCTPPNSVCVREILDDSVAMGLTVIRTWGFGDAGGTAGWNGRPSWPGSWATSRAPRPPAWRCWRKRRGVLVLEQRHRGHLRRDGHGGLVRRLHVRFRRQPRDQ